jgi:glycerol-3-phosphate dehydrogenase
MAMGLVNAAGPWLEDVLQRAASASQDRGVRLIKGSHIVVPRLYEGDHAFMLQNPDRRIVFAIPYEHDYTLIDDRRAVAGPARQGADLARRDRLSVRDGTPLVRTAIQPKDVVWSYAHPPAL